MTKEELKALGLTDEQVTKIADDYGKNYVVKSQFNEKNEELKQSKGEIKKLTGELDDLKKANKDNTELAEQIDKLKAEAKAREEEYKSSIKQMQIDGIVERALITAKAKNIKALKALLDLDDAKVDGDTIKGLDAQIKALKESDAYLFDADKSVKGAEPGKASDNSQTQGTVTAEDFAKMSYADRVNLYNENQELYNQLVKAEDK